MIVEQVNSLLDYIKAAMRKAEYEKLKDGTFYAHIPGFEGLWANGPTVEDARDDLYEALDGWLYVNLFVSKTALPDVGDVRLEPPRRTAN